ncbi:hypothetical protein Droror1_Dr00000408 [Drosera rotundifolia]
MAFTTTMLSWSALEFGGKMGLQIIIAGGDQRIWTPFGACTQSQQVTQAQMSLARTMKFAIEYRGAYSNSLDSTVCPFYCSYSGYKVRVRLRHVYSIICCEKLLI